MNGSAEKRSTFRYKTNIPIVFRTFHALEYYSAKELNHSKDGLAFSVDIKLDPGMTVQIRHKNCPKDCPGGIACESCHGNTLATVHWCHESHVNDAKKYVVGAKYFPYNIGFKSWIYIIAALTAIMVSVVTVSYLTYRAARTNPAKTLHYE